MSSPAKSYAADYATNFLAEVRRDRDARNAARLREQQRLEDERKRTQNQSRLGRLWSGATGAARGLLGYAGNVVSAVIPGSGQAVQRAAEAVNRIEAVNVRRCQRMDDLHLRLKTLSGILQDIRETAKTTDRKYNAQLEQWVGRLHERVLLTNRAVQLSGRFFTRIGQLLQRPPLGCIDRSVVEAVVDLERAVGPVYSRIFSKQQRADDLIEMPATPADELDIATAELLPPTATAISRAPPMPAPSPVLAPLPAAYVEPAAPMATTAPDADLTGMEEFEPQSESDAPVYIRRPPSPASASATSPLRPPPSPASRRLPQSPVFDEAPTEPAMYPNPAPTYRSRVRAEADLFPPDQPYEDFGGGNEDNTPPTE